MQLLCLFAAVCCAMLVLHSIGCEGNDEGSLHVILQAMDKLLDFLIDLPNGLPPETLFGVILAKGEFHVLLSNADTRFHPMANRLRRLVAKCDALIEANQLSDEVSSVSDYGQVVRRLLRPELWTIGASFRMGELSREQLPGHVSPGVDSGTPTAAQSDRCLAELLARPRCHVSVQCRRWESGGVDPPSGYPLTHRLLFLQTARQVGCTADFVDMIRNVCKSMHWEAMAISNLGFPPNMQDLFTEQVALCGIEGFLEFLSPSWRSAILGWQIPEGCFGPQWHNSSVTPKRVRSVNGGQSGLQCDGHMTGVGVAALAVNIRAMLKEKRN